MNSKDKPPHKDAKMKGETGKICEGDKRNLLF